MARDFRRVLLPALASAGLLWAAAPPLAWGWLAWLAPLGWLSCCYRPTAPAAGKPATVKPSDTTPAAANPASDNRLGSGGYLALWLSGCVYWLLILHGIRLAYWPLIFGWLALSLYLAVYIPLFAAVTRVMVGRWRWPLVLAAPTSWLGLECLRSYLLTGYAANTLAHTQVRYVWVIQVADQLGGGGISFIMMTVAAAVWLALASRRLSRSVIASGLWAAALVAGMLAYGGWRLDQTDRHLATRPPLFRGLLVQENTPSIFDNYSPERSQQAWEAYLETTRRGAAEHGPVDVVVWPESTFTANEPWVEQDVQQGLPEELRAAQVDSDQLAGWVNEMQAALRYKARLVASAVREAAAPSPANGEPQDWPYLLVGCDVLVYRSENIERFNSALFIDPQGQLLERYGKMHLVMFGEYIPLGPVLQWLRDRVGLAGLDAGSDAASFTLDNVRLAPNICFESMMPRLISHQLRQLAARGEAPDVLVNITNDSWFRGSSVLDHHLACSILCAVENRRPLLVAANTGLSAHIEGSGRLLAVSPRLQPAAILAEPRRDSRWGLVQAAGYPLAWACGLATLLALLWPVVALSLRR